MAANLVEGSARRSQRDYVHFVSIAIGSASEVRHLIDVAARLGLLGARVAEPLMHSYGRVVRALQALSTALATPRPETRGPRPT